MADSAQPLNVTKAGNDGNRITVYPDKTALSVQKPLGFYGRRTVTMGAALGYIEGLGGQ